ncbi:MAG: hypothetical protein L6306_12985, partial [Planctomycetales bacterium]|nr:hypothetical protein [Planctomycetales bacterium]
MKKKGKKGDSPHLCEAPSGPFRQMGTVPFFPLSPLGAEMADLLESLCLEELSPADAARLEELVRSDPQCCRQYIIFMEMHALVERSGGEGRGAGDEGRGMAGSPAIDLPVGAAVELPSGQWPRTPNPEPPVPPIVLDLSSTTHYPPSTSDFIGSWTFACMVATVIMGVMLLGFWAVKVTHHQHIAEAPSKSVPSIKRPEFVFVGRITGLLDVKWSDDKDFLPPYGYAYVPLGHKYKLDSGLMEITYDTGAKVILQGPCTYEVESTAGGYLSLGKLTARVGAVGGKGSSSKVQGS